MANKGLIVIGIIIIVFVFYVNNVMFSAQEIQQLEIANYLCNAEVFGIPIGQLGQATSPEIAQRCNMIDQFMPVIKYRLYLYGLGIVLVIIGAAIGMGGKKSREKSKPENTKEEIAEESKSEKKKEDEEHVKILKARYARGEITKAQFNEMKKDLD
jgi:hypothetical protein